LIEDVFLTVAVVELEGLARQQALMEDWAKVDRDGIAKYALSWFEGDFHGANMDLQNAITGGSMNSTAGHELHSIIERVAVPVLSDPVVQSMTLEQRFAELESASQSYGIPL
jgi:hypothetical protein